MVVTLLALGLQAVSTSAHDDYFPDGDFYFPYDHDICTSVESEEDCRAFGETCTWTEFGCLRLSHDGAVDCNSILDDEQCGAFEECIWSDWGCLFDAEEPEHCADQDFVDTCARGMVDSGSCLGFKPMLDHMANGGTFSLDFSDVFDEDLPEDDAEYREQLQDLIEPLQNMVIFVEALSQASHHVDTSCFECESVGEALTVGCADWTPPAKDPLQLLKHIITEAEALAQLELPAGRQQLNKLKNNYSTLTKSVKKSSKRVKKAIKNAGRN